MRKRLTLYTFALSAINLLLSQSALANVFTDDYSVLKPEYANDQKYLSCSDKILHVQGIEDGKLTFSLDKNQIFSDMDATVSVAQLKPGAKNPNTDYGGLIFWASDGSNYYAFMVGEDKTFAVMRLIGNKRWINQIDWTTEPTIKTGPDGWNDLRIVTSGNHVTLYINGKKVGEFDGQPRDGGGQFGYQISGSGLFGFKNLSIKY